MAQSCLQMLIANNPSEYLQNITDIIDLFELLVSLPTTSKQDNANC